MELFGKWWRYRISTVPSTKYLYIRMNTTGYITSSSNDVLIPASKLGDATASDVLKGKSFTSINGVKVVGTLESVSTTTVLQRTTFVRWKSSSYYAYNSHKYYSFSMWSFNTSYQIGSNGADIIIARSLVLYQRYTPGGTSEQVISQISGISLDPQRVFHFSTSGSAIRIESGINWYELVCEWSGSTVTVKWKTSVTNGFMGIIDIDSFIFGVYVR